MNSTTRRRVFIVGAGGLGREAFQYTHDSLDESIYEIIGHLDDDPSRAGREGVKLAIPVIGSVSSHDPDPNDLYVMAIGEPSVREKLAAEFKRKGGSFLTVVHPLAYIASNATIGEGCIVAPFATVGAGAAIGAFTHLHFYSSAAHDTRIGRSVSLSPYAAVNGQAVIGECVFLGTHATVNPTKRVGDYSKVTAGSVVYRDVPKGSIADGNPARSRPLLGFSKEASS